MADNSVNRLGQINNTGLTDALFLMVYAEVLAAFQRSTQFMSRTYVRSIPNGKSAQFPVIGRANARYHTPGTEITGDAVPTAEQIITIDGLLISDVSIAEIDEAMNHYDVRSEYTRLLGEAQAQTFDANVARTGILAARSSAVIPSMPGGTKLIVATAKTSGLDLGGALFSAASTLDENFVPDDGRSVFVRPLQYNLLVQETTNINKFWGGEGSFADGNVRKIAGMEIVKSTNLPNTAVTGTYNSKYDVDASKTAALVLARQAVGTVKLIDMKMEAEWSTRRQSTLMLAKQAVGHGILRPDAALEIAVA